MVIAKKCDIINLYEYAVFYKRGRKNKNGDRTMNNKITIIGAGSVGATVAYTLVSTNSVAEIVLIDVNTAKAEAEALDILQSTPYLNPTKIYSGTYHFGCW